jgi:hypothetical protein
LGKIAPCFTVPEFDATLDALRRIAANDNGAATVMCVLGVADAMGKVGGVGLIASRCLPLACPLMLAPGLNRAQIGTVARTLGSMLRRVEEARVATAPAAPPPPKPKATKPPPAVPARSIGGEGTDPFAASASAAAAAPDLFVGMTTNSATPSLTPMRLTPPPPLGGVPRVSSATEQLTAALSQADDLETLFTDPGYRPVLNLNNVASAGASGDMFSGMNAAPGAGGMGGARGAGRTGQGALDAKEFSLL